MATRKKRTTRRTRSKASSPSRASSKTRSPKRILNCLPSTDRDKDWAAESAHDAGLLAAGAVPSAMDLRDGNPWWTIGNQGSTGSCVGWATGDSVARWVLAQAGRIPKSKTTRLSPRFLWMAAKETDQFTSRPTSFIESDGTSLKAALDVARKFGIVLDSDLPFKGGTLFAGSANTFYARASQLRISGYYSLRPASGATKASVLASWRRWLANGGPILTRLDVDETWDTVGSNGKLQTYQPDKTRGGHAVALVGYDSKAFIVRNSWGSGWADKGYAYASNDYAFAAFTEAYGVVS